MSALIASERRLADEQRALLAWSGAVSGDEALDRLKQHIVLVADSLGAALRDIGRYRNALAQLALHTCHGCDAGQFAARTLDAPAAIDGEQVGETPGQA